MQLIYNSSPLILVLMDLNFEVRHLIISFLPANMQELSLDIKFLHVFFAVVNMLCWFL